MAEKKNGNNGPQQPEEEALPSSVLGEITRPGNAESLPEIIDFILGIARGRNFSPERLNEVEKALKAALENAVEVSYKDRQGNIAVVCRHDNWDNLVVAVVDTGDPSNILLADAAFPGEEAAGSQKQKAAARLIKKMTDNIEYKRVEQENTLTFTFSRKTRSR